MMREYPLTLWVWFDGKRFGRIGADDGKLAAWMREMAESAGIELDRVAISLEDKPCMYGLPELNSHPVSQ